MKPKNDVWAYILAGAVVGYLAYTGRQALVAHSHAGWEIEDGAPWCAVDQGRKTLACRYFSQTHCDIGAVTDEIRGPVGPLCVPRPK